MLLFDAHLDMAWNATEWNRDLMLPVSQIREFERQFPGIVPGDCTVSWADMKRGHIGLAIVTLLPRLNRKQPPLTFPQSPEAAYALAHAQLAYYRAMTNRGAIRMLDDADDLNDHIHRWTTSDPASMPIGCILSMEGAPPIMKPEMAHEWYHAGLRIVGPAHYGPNQYCHGTGCEGGLTSEGRRLIQEMEKAGLLLDVTHLADQSFWEALDLFSGPVLASHHNCRALAPGDRQLNDDQIRALIERGAVIGAAFDNWMIIPGWKRFESDPATVKMHMIVDHIDHICQLAGNARHCGLGTDLDGGFGKEQSPIDLDTIADLPKMATLLRDRGYSETDIQGIMSQNFIDFFRRAWA